jgi:hypothetical protein
MEGVPDGGVKVATETPSGTHTAVISTRCLCGAECFAVDILELRRTESSA